jgi:hypothetical protein
MVAFFTDEAGLRSKLRVIFFNQIQLEKYHILDYRNSGNLQIIEHLNALNNIDETDFLGRSDYHSAVEFQFLAQGDLYVACPWRHIDNEIV